MDFLTLGFRYCMDLFTLGFRYYIGSLLAEIKEQESTTCCITFRCKRCVMHPVCFGQPVHGKKISGENWEHDHSCAWEEKNKSKKATLGHPYARLITLLWCVFFHTPSRISSHPYVRLITLLWCVFHHTRTYVSSHPYAYHITPIRTPHHTPSRISSHQYVRLITPLCVSHNTGTYVSSHPYAYLITPVRTSHHTPLRVSSHPHTCLVTHTLAGHDRWWHGAGYHWV